MWELTTLAGPSTRLGGPMSFSVDGGGGVLRNDECRVALTMRSRAFVEFLAWAKEGEVAGQHSGWVPIDDIASLPEWIGERSRASLRSQVRREIKALHDAGFDLIEAPARKLLCGPFRLREALQLPASVTEQLERRFGSWQSAPIRAMDLVMRLEGAERLWRRAFLFDKAEEILSFNLDLDEPVHGAGPMFATIELIDRTRRLRDLGNFESAHAAIETALATAEKETNNHLRSNLRASCHFQKGWLLRKEKRYQEAEGALQKALDALEGGGHLRVLGQILSLRALLRARVGRFEEAFHDLQVAGDYWLIEGDLYNLFSVYHNVGYILIKQADAAGNASLREKVLRDAIFCCSKSDTYCRQFKVAQNSVISLIQLAALHTRVGEFD